MQDGTAVMCQAWRSYTLAAVGGSVAKMAGHRHCLQVFIFKLSLQVKAAYERHAGGKGNDVAGFMRELGFDNFGATVTSKDSTELFRSAIKLTHPSRLNPRQPTASKVMLVAVDCGRSCGNFHAASCLTSVPQCLDCRQQGGHSSTCSWRLSF